MNKLKLSFVVCLAVATVLVSAEDVVDLSANSVSSFKSTVAGLQETVLVEFFAPWCGHCKRLAPEYEKAATQLKSHDPPVPLAKVDCTTDQGKDLCQEFGVSGYPTLKIFKGGEFASEYNGPRDADGIVKYMRSQVGPASKQHSSFKSLNDQLKAAKDVVVVGVFANDKDKHYTKFMKGADRLRESVVFAHVFAESASDSISAVTAIKDAPTTTPAVILVRPSHAHNKFEPSHVSFNWEGDVADWVNKNFHGLVGLRTQSNTNEFHAPLVVAFYDVDYVKNPKGTNYWRNRILKVAKNYADDFTFAISNAQQFSGELEEFGLEPDSSRDAAPLIGARDKDNKKYVLKEKFTVDAFEKFLVELSAGNLEPFVKSEEVPADNDKADVKVAVGKNFDDLVINSKKDVLVEFYAPWCGHCKKLAPTYEELGKALKNEPGVEIVKMDATANDVSTPFVVHGFPTIYWYPKDTKVPRKYEGGRELDDFISYVAKYATDELEGYGRDGKKKEGKEEL